MSGRDPVAQRAYRAQYYRLHCEEIKARVAARKARQTEEVRRADREYQEACRQAAREIETRTAMPACGCGCGNTTKIAARTDRRVGHVRGQPQRFLKGHKPKAVGRYIGANGYFYARCPGHPKASGGYYIEHVIIAERALGKCMPPGAEVHHADGDKLNNVNANLVVCENRAYHVLLHARMKLLDRGLL